MLFALALRVNWARGGGADIRKESARISNHWVGYTWSCLHEIKGSKSGTHRNTAAGNISHYCLEINEQIDMEFDVRGKNKYNTDLLKSSRNYVCQLL